MQMIPSAEAIGQGDCEASKTTGARTFVTRVAFTHAATLCNASGSRSEGWKTRTREISRKMNDVLARAACDFEDDALRRQDITKDTENEIAIAQCCRGMLAGVVHHPHGFAELGPQNSPLGESRRNRRMSVHWCCRRPWEGDVSISGNSVRIVTDASLGGHGVGSVTIDARRP